MKATKLLLVSFLVVCVSTTNVLASEESDKAKIQRAMKAAPSSISADAEIRDVTPGWPILREAKNGSQWTCFPGVPLNEGDKHPMCNDIVWMEWLYAAVNLFYGDNTWTFTTDTVGYSYMQGPHIMMLFPTRDEIAHLPRDPNAGGPYVMWDNQDAFPFDALIHVMVPLTDRDR